MEPSKLIIYTTSLARAQRSGMSPAHMDISIKSGDTMFAPTWDMVNAYKAGTLSKEEYTIQYYTLMRQSYRDNKDTWDYLVRGNYFLRGDRTLILCCYCKAGDFCHRVLLADILIRLAKHQKIEAEYRGEIA